MWLVRTRSKLRQLISMYSPEHQSIPVYPQSWVSNPSWDSNYIPGIWSMLRDGHWRFLLLAWMNKQQWARHNGSLSASNPCLCGLLLVSWQVLAVHNEIHFLLACGSQSSSNNYWRNQTPAEPARVNNMDMYKNNAKGIIVFTNIFHNYWRLESCYRLSHRSTIDTTLLSLEKGCNVFYKFDFVAQFHRTERGVRTKIQTLHRENQDAPFYASFKIRTMFISFGECRKDVLIQNPSSRNWGGWDINCIIIAW